MVHETPDDGDSSESGADAPRAFDPTVTPGPEDTDDPARGYSELGEIAADAERLVREGLEQTERSIRRHPLAAVGIAAGLGVLIGALLGRDR